jgi:hypothetical protein
MPRKRQFFTEDHHNYYQNIRYLLLSAERAHGEAVTPVLARATARLRNHQGNGPTATTQPSCSSCTVVNFPENTGLSTNRNNGFIPSCAEPAISPAAPIKRPYARVPKF